MNIKKILIVVLIVFCMNITTIFAAHDCYYSYTQGGSENDVTISYDAGKVSVTSEEIEETFKGFRAFFNYFSLFVDYDIIKDSSPLLTESVGTAISKDSCPSEVYVCAGTTTSVDFLLRTPFAMVETVLDLFNWITEDYSNFLDWAATFIDDYLSAIAIAPEVVAVEEVLIVSGSQRDAEQSYGYKKGFFEANWDGIYKKDEDFTLSWYSWASIDCNAAYYNGDKTTFDVNCPSLSATMALFTTKAYEYKDCSTTDCKRDLLEEVNQLEEKLKNQCYSILENQDYYLTDGGKENACMKECLAIKSNIEEIKTSAQIKTEGSRVCGFSEKLFTWALNIFKWIKYILPVAVIIFGILDFIKAIGADKEDELKKAQKRFITRIIAAALVFIIPLIIEFILIKMGFTYNGCGLF